jgi:hypothetical protein
MEYSKAAIDYLSANIGQSFDVGSDPEKFNLAMGLINIAKAIGEIEKRLVGLEEKTR